MISGEQKTLDYYEGAILGAREEGLEEGIEQGIQQGVRDTQLANAKTALHLDIPRPQVIQITGLDADTIDQLADELKVPTS